jgi:ribosomal protein L11 methyltransferase
LESSFFHFEFKITPFYPGSEILIAELSQIGFDSFQDHDNSISAYIKVDFFDDYLFSKLRILNNNEFEISFEKKHLKKINWNSKWESNFNPILIDECCIRAPFHSKTDCKYDLIIEPKMSFGTGHHETTAMMIRYLLEDDFINSSVCDVGCGTGILAILAEKKGASVIDAIDIDNWSFINSKENIKKNNSKIINVYQGEISILRNNFYDKIFANINLNILIREISIYSKSLINGGFLYLSGFYKDDVKSLLELASKLNLKFVDSKEANNWTCLKFIKY